MRARPLDDAEDIVRRARDDDADASTSSATASARETLERFFSRWRTVADVKRARRTLARRALLEWRRVVERDVRARRCLAEAVQRHRSTTVSNALAAWRDAATSRRRQRRAFDAHVERWRRRRARMMFTWWFRVARSSARERERARAEAHELRSLDAELRLARANAERDAAVERAEMTEKMYKAIEFRDRKDRLRDERIAEEETRACVRGAVATRSEPKKGARDGDQKRRALASVLRELRAHAVEQFRLAEYEANQNRILCATSGSRAARGRLTNDERWRALL